MSETRKIKTVMEPDRVYEVSEQEYTDLSRQGLLHEPDKAEHEETDTGSPEPQQTKKGQTK